MLLPFIDSGEPGLTVRPYDKILNVAAPYVVPVLVKSSVVLKPLYRVADKLRRRKRPSKFRTAKSNSYKPKAKSFGTPCNIV